VSLDLQMMNTNGAAIFTTDPRRERRPSSAIGFPHEIFMSVSDLPNDWSFGESFDHSSFVPPRRVEVE